MNDKPTFAELKAAHEADVESRVTQKLGESNALKRESALIALLESAIPFLEDYLSGLNHKGNGTVKLKDLLKQLGRR